MSDIEIIQQIRKYEKDIADDLKNINFVIEITKVNPNQFLSIAKTTHLTLHYVIKSGYNSWKLVQFIVCKKFWHNYLLLFDFPSHLYEYRRIKLYYRSNVHYDALGMTNDATHFLIVSKRCLQLKESEDSVNA